MKVAVVGAGIAGLVVTRLLARAHEVTLFEANAWAGGHTNTVRVEVDGATHAVDTGFVVYDAGTYPHFARLLDELGIATQPSEMSFSVRCTESGLEYGGRSLGALLAQPGNLVRPAFHRLLRDVLRFNRAAGALARSGDTATVDECLTAHGYSRELRDWYLVPMAAAIWSARPADVVAMPASWVVRFFEHHGLLRTSGQPQWRTVTGGAARYVEALLARLHARVRLGCAVRGVRRGDGWVDVRSDGGTGRFDAVVMATHGSQALGLLEDPTPREREVLSAFAEQENEAVLHTDVSLLPRARRAWSSWNVHLGRPTDRVAVTYDMRRLQRLSASVPVCVTLNATAAIDPARVLRRFVYHHPVYTRAAVAAQARREAISGVARTYFCGAYWGYGFHEDGVESALAVARHFDVERA